MIAEKKNLQYEIDDNVESCIVEVTSNENESNFLMLLCIIIC